MRSARRSIPRQKWAERLIFPRLDVARAPVVHQDKTENMIGRAIDWHRSAQRVTGTNQERHFQFIIETFRLAECWRGCIWRLGLPLWPTHVSPADDHRAGAPVVRD